MPNTVLRDITAAGLCAPGAKQWCKANGFSFRELATVGLDIEKVRETGCPLALRMVEAALTRLATETSAHG